MGHIGAPVRMPMSMKEYWVRLGRLIDDRGWVAEIDERHQILIWPNRERMGGSFNPVWAVKMTLKPNKVFIPEDSQMRVRMAALNKGHFPKTRQRLLRTLRLPLK